MLIFRMTIILFLIMLRENKASRILAYFPTPSYSHQVVFRHITQELARRGHEVIVVTTDPAYPEGKAPINLTEINVHDVSYERRKEFLKLEKGKKEGLLRQLEFLFKRWATMFYKQMQVSKMKEIMAKERNYFDLLLLESCNTPILGFIHKFDAPAIQISSFGAFHHQYESMGSLMHPFLYTTPVRQKLYNLSLREKFMEYYTHIQIQNLITNRENYETSVMKQIFGKDVPPWEKLQSKVEMLFLYEHPIWGDNRPIPTNIISFGSVHQNLPKQLPEELQFYLDSSRNGVIYISFGTNALPSLLPPEKIKVMTDVLSQLPYDVLWKWDKDILPGQSSNIKISKWFPQADLLKHPKIKIFITQGGLQSTEDAIFAAVPVIGIPLLGDQWYNTEKYVRHKIGKKLDIFNLSEAEFEEAIRLLMNDNSYKNNVLKLRSYMRENRISPLNQSIWWAEHIIKYGRDRLMAKKYNMSWMEYYEVELLLTAVSMFLAVLAAFAITIILALKFLLLYKITKRRL